MRLAYAVRMCVWHVRVACARTYGRTNKDGESTYVPSKSLRLSTRTRTGEMVMKWSEVTHRWVQTCGYATIKAWLTTRKAHKMSPAEAADLVELSTSIWANVKNTPRTCEAWFLALAHTNFYDAKDAIGSLARERKTVHVSDIVKRAAAVRESLLRSLPPIPDPPVELADDLAAEVQWLRTARERQLYEARMTRQSVPA